jgi:hypothetical protein
MSGENPEPAPEAAPSGWRPVTAETKFEAGRLYVVLVPGYPAFLAEWLEGGGDDDEDEGGGGLVDFPDHHDVWLNRGQDRPDAALTARYFFELPAIPPGAKAEVDEAWRQYYQRVEQWRREHGL